MSTILFLLLGTARLARSFPLGEVLSFLKGVSLARFKPCLTHEVTPFFPFCLSLLQLFHTHLKKHNELQLEEHHWVNGGTPFAGIGLVHELAHKGEIKCSLQMP